MMSLRTLLSITGQRVLLNDQTMKTDPMTCANSIPTVEIDGPLDCVVVNPADFPHGETRHNHRHKLGQVIHAISGLIAVKTRHGTWTVPTGRGVWIPPMQEHEVDILSDTKMYSIYLNPEHTIELPSQCTIINVPPVLRELAIYISDINQSCSNVFASAIAVVIAHLAQDSLSSPLHVPIPQDQKLKKIYSKLFHNPADQRPIHEWGGTVGLSSRSLSRKLKQETGMTFRVWRQQIRLLSSLELLSNGQAVTTVAHDVGYETTSAFTTAFRQTFGTTPSSFFNHN